jgi:hypothetical protein
MPHIPLPEGLPGIVGPLLIISDRGGGKTPTVYRVAAYRTVWGWWVKLPVNTFSPEPLQSGRLAGIG